MVWWCTIPWTDCHIYWAFLNNICLSDGTKLGPGPCLTAATWCYRKNFSQWECSFHWKLHCHWLEFLRQHQIAVVRRAQVWGTSCYHSNYLTHWGWVTHICVNNLTSIGSDNGLSPGRRQAIIWTDAGILFIGPLGTNFSEIIIGIHTFSFKKMHLKISSAKWRLFFSASMC